MAFTPSGNRPTYSSNSSSSGTRAPYSGGQRSNYNNRGNQGPRKNDRIRATEVRLLSPEGNQLGIMATRDALELAKRYDLDLVEISAAATPPVCRIMDFGKFLYEQSKKGKDAHKSVAGKIKEIKFRLHIDQHDYITKMRHAEEFLEKGFKLKITLSMKGRELEHAHLGLELVQRAIKDLETMGSADGEPKRMGRNVIVSVTPLAASKRKPKYADFSKGLPPDRPDDSDRTEDDED